MNFEEESKAVYGVNGDVVLDGILNQASYETAPYKLLWILRETWLENSWTMLQDEGIYKRIGNSPTLHPMVYVVYSIFDKFQKWKDMDYIRDDPEMAEVLRKIAYINVKKSVGGTSSFHDDIYSWFKKGERIIKWQVSEYKPDIVIGCAPFMGDIFRWNADRSKPVKEGFLTYVSDPGKQLLIEAPHPSQRGSRELYVDALVEIINKKKPNLIKPK